MTEPRMPNARSGGPAIRLKGIVKTFGETQVIPGPGVAANYTVTSAIAGRPIVGSTAGATSVVVNLVQPNSLFLETQNRLDMRVGKTFRVKTAKVQGFADVFNLLNRGTVTSVNQTYGAVAATNAWYRPLTIMEGRYVRFGVQMSF